MKIYSNIKLSAKNSKKPSFTDIAVNDDGVIVAIGTSLQQKGEVIDGTGAHLTPAWVDIGTHACDPGFEHREDLQSVAAAAADGGFSVIAVFGETSPAVHSKSEVQYILHHRVQQGKVSILPIGAVSVEVKGKDLAELYDMHQGGAVAFSDGSHPIQDSGLLLRALQYVNAFDGLIINQSHLKSLSFGGQMHEGVVSTSLGLKGLPSLAEEVAVQRDLSLLEYANSRLHIHCISTAKSVALIREAKQKGLKVTASVAIANLCFTDGQLADFDSNWKVFPPLRSENDRQSLIDGLKDGTIDCICTNHTPWDDETKNLEFPYAEFGMTGLQTAYSLCNTYLKNVFTAEELTNYWAIAPREILKLPIPMLEVGALAANFALHYPEKSWKFWGKTNLSRSKNSPFLGTELKGKAQLL